MCLLSLDGSGGRQPLELKILRTAVSAGNQTHGTATHVRSWLRSMRFCCVAGMGAFCRCALVNIGVVDLMQSRRPLVLGPNSASADCGRSRCTLFAQRAHRSAGISQYHVCGV